MTYQFSTVADIQAGVGSIKTLGDTVTRLQVKHLFVVTDKGIAALGLLDLALQSLTDRNIKYTVFTEVEPDPSDQTVNLAARTMVAANCDGVLGLGGGSSMDVAKLVAVLAAGTQPLNAMYGVNQIRGGRLPLIQVPTTSGTGSEVTMVSVVTTGETTKSGVVSRVLLADAVILDAELTLGLPPHITAATGIDAMVHAIEAYTSARLKNPMSDALAISALKKMAGAIKTAVLDGSNIEARADMQLGAMMAGQAFANAPVAGVHALAYPIGGIYHVAHGLSNSLVLPHVLRFNGSKANKMYGELAPIIMQDDTINGDNFDTDQLADYLLTLAGNLGIPTSLRDVNIPRTALKDLANAAMLQQRLLVNNPRSIDFDAALDVYEQAW